MCITTPLWRHNASGVTKFTQNMNADMCNWEIIWIVRFVNYVSIVLVKSMIIRIRILVQIVRNNFLNNCVAYLWQLKKFMTNTSAISSLWLRDVWRTEFWIYFSNVCALCKSIHDFSCISCIVEITITTATPTPCYNNISTQLKVLLHHQRTTNQHAYIRNYHNNDANKYFKQTAITAYILDKVKDLLGWYSCEEPI